jgi:HD-like signal output (HDOD) protein/CheY-like chemotaxis protein
MSTTNDPANRPTILFVDDEADVLAGVRRSLHRERSRWDVRFALTGREALQIVDSQPVQVVVTDMRMPGMSGADVLKYLQAKHPAVVRIVLSGEASTSAAFRSLPHVHRWLPKPCDRDSLVETLESALQDMATDESDDIEQLIGSVTSLPSPPGLYLSLQQALNSGQASFDELTGLIERDPAVTAKILQWGRSPLIGLGDAATVRGAIAAVGIRSLTDLVLSIEVLVRMAPESEIPGLDSEALRDHAELTAQVAAYLVEPKLRGDARTAGLLHSIGMLVLATRAHDRLVETVELARSEGLWIEDAERRVLKRSHGEIGARLLALWGLPQPVVDAVRDHRAAPDAGGGKPLDRNVAAAVGIASWIAARTLADEGRIDPVFAHPMGIDALRGDGRPAWADVALAALHDRQPTELAETAS